MSALSNDFHALLDDVKSTFNTLVGDGEKVADGVGEAAITALTTVLQQAPAVLVQAASAGVTAALASGGNVAAMLATAEAAAINTLVQVGKPILETDLASLKAAVLAFFVSAPAASASTSNGTVAPSA